ncbi:MAG: type II secretion system F family protein [Rhodospirillales bacterium]|nr:type II secretion system F family protein [Rhodospirillales bacterium]
MIESLPLLVGTVAACAFVLLAASIIFRETRRARTVDRRLAILRELAISAGPALEGRTRRSGSIPLPMLGLAVVQVGSMLVPVGAAEREKLARMLRMGGFGRPEALSTFLSIKLAGALALGAAAGLWAAGSATVGQYGFLVVLAGLAGLVIGGVVPEYGLRTLVARRARAMTSALPDALDMMVMCLETGLTVERAMMTVAEGLASVEPNLAGEFRQIEAELRLGSDRRAVLGEYYRRTEIDGLRDFAMSLIQSDRYGTPLSQSMRSIAADARVQKAARIATQAERLPVLMTLPMLLFVVPGTMILVAGPAVLTALKALSSLGGS